MRSIPGFSASDRRCIYRPCGSATAAQLAHLIARALLTAREGSLEDALIDITAVSLFETPGPLLRRWAVSFWSRTVRNELRIAIVARPEHICPEKTGLLVAAEEGLLANIFEVERDAVAWLDEIARVRRAEGSAVNASNAGSREACTSRL